MKPRLKKWGHIQVCTAGWWIQINLNAPHPQSQFSVLATAAEVRFHRSFKARTFFEAGFCGGETDSCELDDERASSACILSALFLADTARPCPLPGPPSSLSNYSSAAFPSQWAAHLPAIAPIRGIGDLLSVSLLPTFKPMADPKGNHLLAPSQILPSSCAHSHHAGRPSSCHMSCLDTPSSVSSCSTFATHPNPHAH